jgi:hypothetical protein
MKERRERMGLFSKKQKIDYDSLFREKYKSINQLSMQAQDEVDFQIKESLLALVVEEYKELLNYIDQGANFEKEHFLALMENVEKELKSIHQINQDA